MALISCPECSHQVSDAAETCPSCGVCVSGGVARPDSGGMPQLQLELELTRFDLDWERERKRYVMHSKYGREVVPQKWAAVVVAMLTLVAGIAIGIWLSSMDPVASPDAPKVGIFFAALVILIGGAVSFWYFIKAEAYEQAHAMYLRRKEEARMKYEDLDGLK